MQELSEQQVANLTKLANYLINLPQDYQYFDMGGWAVILDEDGELSYLSPEEVKPECGTVCCAAGHAPLIGIGDASAYRSWWGYIDDNLLKTDLKYDGRSREFQWCFAAEWAEEGTDNTPQGAGKRILWMLEHNDVPDNWKEQLYGEAELCYN